jgi:hypothetical protein
VDHPAIKVTMASSGRNHFLLDDDDIAPKQTMVESLGGSGGTSQRIVQEKLRLVPRKDRP